MSPATSIAATERTAPDMSSPPEKPAPGGTLALGKSVASMGVATAADLVAQVTIPILLVRLLDETDFGLYRTLWLIASTLPGVLALGIPNSLYYFLPRSGRARSSTYVLQATLHMAAAGVVAGACTALFLWLQGDAHPLGWPAIVFVALWVGASVLDALFIAQQKVPTQAKFNLAFTALRVAAILGTAAIFQAWWPVLVAHVVVVALKAIACGLAVHQYVGSARPSRDALREQYGYALPVGVSTTLYLLRGRLDQWLVASLFSAAQFGLYSIAAVFGPLQTLIRVTVSQVIQPELSRLQSQQDLVGMRALNRRANLAVTLLLFPAIAFIGLWAESILSVLFTDRYSGAAPFVRMYLLTMAIESLEIAIVVVSMGHGRFVMKVDAIVLPFAVGAALLGSKLFGLAGAPAGAVVGAILAQVLLYRRFASLSGIRVREAQEWSAIARIALASALSAVVSAVAASALVVPGGTIGMLVLAGVAFTVTYRVLLSLLGLGAKVRIALGSRLSRLIGFGGGHA
jgi:O-antigen/teichoic acid export membrane protein